MKSVFARFILILALVGVSAGLTGCGTPDDQNVSARPWNSPKGWESGFPSALTEGK
jgi:hypothetical protein